MKKIFKKIIHKLGYDIKKIYNGFLLNNNIIWLKKIKINTVLDIGANNGQFAEFIHSVFPNAEIHSFEPIPECFKKLTDISKNINNIIPYNFAIGSENKESTFFLNDFMASSSFLQVGDSHKKNFPGTANTREIKVNKKTLDNVISGINIIVPVLLKIDVQGYEMEVFHGASAFFENFKGLLLVETSIIKLYDNEPNFDEIYSHLKKYNFEYLGNLDQMYSPIDGKILQVDALFQKNMNECFIY